MRRGDRCAGSTTRDGVGDIRDRVVDTWFVLACRRQGKDSR